MDDGVEAYKHYRNGKGADKTFSFMEYKTEDNSGSGTVGNVEGILKTNTKFYLMQVLEILILVQQVRALVLIYLSIQQLKIGKKQLGLTIFGLLVLLLQRI